MNAVPFDTLKMAHQLETAGFTPPQAVGASEALAEALVGADLATKGDIAAVRTELKGEIASLRTELKGDMNTLRTELKGGIELLRRDMTIPLGGMMVVGFGALAAVIRLTPHP